MIRYILLFLPLFSFSHGKIVKKANSIEVSRVSFKNVANALLDAGYILDKVDSSFQTIKTDFKEGTGKNKWMKLRIFIRMKDSTAVLTGQWYNSMFIGGKLLGQEQNIENSTYKIEYTYGNPKNCFLELNAFAESFKKPVSYSVK